MSPVEAKNPVEISVNVQFTPHIESMDDLAARISKIANPQVITWFIGRKGLREDWLYYLRDSLISTIRKVSKSQKIYLYNLRNWEFLKGIKGEITAPKASKVIKRIEALKCPDIALFDSSRFFTYLKECNIKEWVSYAETVIWKRKFIWEKSVDAKPYNTTLKETLGNSLITASIAEMDPAKSYSALQYMEGIFLTHEMVKGDVKSPVNNLVFLLPNDEEVYFRDDASSFQKDIKQMLNMSDIDLKERAVNITFIPFKWGEGNHQRPYLSDQKAIKGRLLQELDKLKV